MPFGLFNAPSTFQVRIEAVIHDLQHEAITAYIGNILIYLEWEP